MMATATPKITFDKFLIECPEDGLYELVNGEIVEIISTRNHIDVADCIRDSFHTQIKKNLSLNYVVTSKTAIRTVNKA